MHNLSIFLMRIIIIIIIIIIICYVVTQIYFENPFDLWKRLYPSSTLNFVAFNYVAYFNFLYRDIYIYILRTWDFAICVSLYVYF